MEEYANNLTARASVYTGYGTSEGLGGSFDFYKLGNNVFGRWKFKRVG
jgi:hypothetical protein